MATKELKWDCLTPDEAKTLAALVKKGTKICAAPIEIEHSGQLEVLGITWNQVRTWRIGSEPIKVHLTPTDERTAKFLLDELRARHRDEYRKRRCMIPGKQKNLIFCPEHNRCSECPFPDARDHHRANNLSWDELIGTEYEKAPGERETDAVNTKMEVKSVLSVIDAKNPKFTKAIVLKELYGMSVAEIAKTMNEFERNVYYFLTEAKKLGKQHKRDNQ